MSSRLLFPPRRISPPPSNPPPAPSVSSRVSRLTSFLTSSIRSSTSSSPLSLPVVHEPSRALNLFPQLSIRAFASPISSAFIFIFSTSRRFQYRFPPAINRFDSFSLLFVALSPSIIYIGLTSSDSPFVKFARSLFFASSRHFFFISSPFLLLIYILDTNLN